MAAWVRFDNDGQIGFGAIEGDTITVHDGDLFASPRPTGATLGRDAVTLLSPCVPSKMVCLWNNSRASAAKLNLNEPVDPLYFFKASTAFSATGAVIPRPASYDGRVLFEAELGIVIGKTCKAVSEADAADYVLGFTCVNDVTALDLLRKDESFPQWARCKSFDGFGPFGPAIVTGLDPNALVIKSLLDGRERQNFPATDMFFMPYRLVSLISQDLTLLPGDVVSCGTSLGALPMKPGAKIDIVIDGIGTLSNTMG